MSTEIEKHHAATFLLLGLNALLDSGKLDHISVAETLEHVEKRDVLAWLRKVGGRGFDISVYQPDGPYAWFGTYWPDVLLELKRTYGDGQRKWGIRNRGLCLLIAWTNEILQSGKGWEPGEDLGPIPRW